MDDGAKSSDRSKGKGFYFHTEGFTPEEVYLLISMLHYKLNIECSAQKHGGKLMIYIKTKSMNTFYNLVSPHFHDSMRYKLVQHRLTLSLLDIYLSE